MQAAKAGNVGFRADVQLRGSIASCTWSPRRLPTRIRDLYRAIGTRRLESRRCRLKPAPRLRANGQWQANLYKRRLPAGCKAHECSYTYAGWSFGQEWLGVVQPGGAGDIQMDPRS